ncbi:MAG: class I SAM-dependent methyltransferase [Pirellula sp.]|jgi:hypothetical protein
MVIFKGLSSVKRTVSRILLEAERSRSRRFIRTLELARLFLDNRPPDAFPPDYLDLAFLYKLIRARKPKTVLEFGCGCSTVVIAVALQHNAENYKSVAKLWSFDADEHWAAVCRESIPPELRNFCEVEYTPLEVVEYQGQQVFSYLTQSNFEKGIDFVYLDGPALTESCRASVDPVRLEPFFNTKCTIVVDGRSENVGLLKRGLKHKYQVQDRYRYFNSVFTRNG